MSDQDDAPKIHIDSDWKAQAQAEKEKLSQKLKEEEQSKKSPGGPGSGAGGGGGMQPATFESLISILATQALYALGSTDPRTGQRFENLDLSRHHIDLLGVIEEKTKGNLTEDEAKMLSMTIYELRSRYIQVVGAPKTV